MVQVHTLRDLEAQNDTAFPRTTVLFNESAPQRPRLIDIIFPGFKTHSFIFIISMVQIAIHILVSFQNWGWLPQSGFSFSSFGNSYGPPIVHSGQVWRFITPLFLHAGLIHLIFNMFFQMRMGFPLEKEFGTRLFAMIYMTCGVAGNLFSLALAPCKHAVGASTAGFGLIGVQIAYTALTWHLIQRKDEVVFNLIFFFMMALMMSVGPDSIVDWRGHMGGFIAGFALGLIYLKSTSRPAWHDKAQTIAIATLALLFIGSAVALFAIPLQNRDGCNLPRFTM